MKSTISAILSMLLLANCTNSVNKTIDKPDRIQPVPEGDKASRENHEKNNEANKAACIFSDPDTAVNGIKIRDVESTLNILGKKTKLEGDSTHLFYSVDKKQTLGLTVHPGDYYSQVSIFSISYSHNLKRNIRQINSKEFKTGKGIKLGITKENIIERLGTCYTAKDSSKNAIELYYRLELPNDSNTKLLERNNMPIYYASYRLKNNKLENIEFGFEYP